MSEKPTKKTKRKRPYKMSPRALQQRRTAALKDGAHASRPENAVGVHCAPGKPLHCPDPGEDGEGCTLHKEAAAQGQAIGICPKKTQQTNNATEAFARVFADGDMSQVHGLASRALGAVATITINEANRLATQGLVQIQVAELPDGTTLEKPVLDPAANTVPRYMRLAGLDAASNVTPQGNKSNDPEVADEWEAMVELAEEPS